MESNEQNDRIEKVREIFAEGMGKYDKVFCKVGKDIVLFVGTDCVFDEAWSAFHELLLNFANGGNSLTTCNTDIAIDEASRLRDKFVKSLERVYGVKLVEVFDEF